MPDLLLELFSEEIPARVKGRAADDLKKMVAARLVDAGLVYEGARAFVTPRRLTLFVQGVPARQPDLKEERKGPRVGAPEGAIAGFLKAAGLSAISEATIQKDPKKGDFYIALTEKSGRPAIDVIGEMLQVVLRTFPWPKSMRWGAQSANPGSLEWVRPLHAIVATFGPETEEPEIVHVQLAGIKSGNITYGHRFLAPGPIQVRHFGDYVTKLEKAKVVLDPARRREIILSDAKNLAFAQGYQLIEDEGLLDEVAGLVEWPVVLMGTFDESFLEIPGEVIRATIRNNQKCFVLRDTKSGRLANRFILTSNTEAADGGRAIIAGAIEEHYKPAGPNDRTPSDPVSIAVALTDKIDTLVGFWAIDEKPTGSKDPYALRRAALGVIRIVLDNALRLNLLKIVDADSKNPVIANDLLSFLADRLKVQLREQGARHDLVDAVLAQHGEGHDDLLLIVRRVEALGKFLATDDGVSLLSGYKRATNILRIEEKKDGFSYHGKPDPHLYLQPEERELASAIHAAKEEAAKAVAREEFEGAMAVTAKLRPHVDAVFEKVTVNVPAADRRENRLKLLNEIREATRAVADFSKIEG